MADKLLLMYARMIFTVYFVGRILSINDTELVNGEPSFSFIYSKMKTDFSARRCWNSN